MPDLAVLLPSLDPGGAEKVMLNLANALVGQGFSVDMVLGQVKGDFLPMLDQRVRTVDLGTSHIRRSLPALRRYLRRERPHCLLSSLPHLNLAVLLARALSGVYPRLVVVEHGVASSLRTQPARFSQRFLPLAMRLLYPRADAVVAVSSSGADHLSAISGLPRERITVIHNPVDLPDIRRKAVLPLDHPWFAPGGPPVIVSAGRLTPVKDYPTLLQAFARLRAHDPARLIILGEGELHADLQALAQTLGITPDVQFAGYQANPFAFISRAALLVLASRWEGFGNVLVEALACGTPVVSTDCPGGPREILAGGKFGRLVPVGDAPALADAMQAVLAHPLPAAVLQERAQVFSVEIALQKYLPLLGLEAG